MPVADFFAGDFARYFRIEADRPGALWVFQHVPKTAGSSFSDQLSRRVAPYANVHADHQDLARPARETLAGALDAFLAEHAAKPYRSVSGHLRGPQVTRIRQAHRPVKVITMLRDPVSRVVSDFRYMRTPSHPDHQNVISRFPDLAAYVDDPRSRNMMFRFLRRNPKVSVEDAIADLEQKFAFIGTLETYDFSSRVLFRLLGEESAPTVHKRRTEDLPANEIPGLEALKPRIAEANALDVRLYEHFSARLEAVRGKAEAWMDRAPTEAPRPAAR